jgi:molecular chaperone GrpE
LSKKRDGVEADPGSFDTEGNYILEDTGENLSDFEQAALRDVAAQGETGVEASAELESLRAENARLRDQNIRKLAEFENFRKRSEREKNEYFRYALGDFMKDLLPVIDNFDRALTVSADGGTEILEGVELIHKQFSDVLQKYGLSPIDEAGVPFDPQIHEAVIREENPDVPSHSVVEVLQKGYFLNDRLLRPAMVRVAVGGPETAAGIESEEI